MVPLQLIRKEDVNKGCLWEEECSRPVKYRYASYAISHAYVTTSCEYSFGVLFPAALISCCHARSCEWFEWFPT